MTPERRAEAVAMLKTLASVRSPIANGMLSSYDDGATPAWAIEEARKQSDALYEVVAELETTATLRADLASTRAQMEEMKNLINESSTRHLANAAINLTLAADLAKAKERIAELEKRLKVAEDTLRYQDPDGSPFVTWRPR